jgi:hypothetical protein
MTAAGGGFEDFYGMEEILCREQIDIPPKIIILK